MDAVVVSDQKPCEVINSGLTYDATITLRGSHKKSSTPDLKFSDFAWVETTSTIFAFMLLLLTIRLGKARDALPLKNTIGAR